MPNDSILDYKYSLLKVQANEKGGLADAQSSGPGQTSSQAQIGFSPQSDNADGSNSVFNGGGQASSQSGAYSGQSQSQIQGKFRYGISYHGAAQAASGTKEQVDVYRQQNKELFKSIGQIGRLNRWSKLITFVIQSKLNVFIF